MLDLEAIKARRSGVVAILGAEPWTIERGETEEQDEHGDTTGDTLPIALIGPTGAGYEGPSPVLQLVGFHTWFDAVAEFHAHAPKDVDALLAEVEILRDWRATVEAAPIDAQVVVQARMMASTMMDPAIQAWKDHAAKLDAEVIRLRGLIEDAARYLENNGAAVLSDSLRRQSTP